MTNTMTTTATDKQIAFIGKLATERCVPFNATGWTKRTASAEIDRLLAMPKPATPTTTTLRFAPQPQVPEGYYAVPSATGNNDLDFWAVQHSTDPGWVGFIKVKRVIGGHIDTPVRGAESRKALRAILDHGIDEGRMKYAEELEHCYRCNRSLTDLESRGRGVGPDCATILGIS